MGLQRNSDGLEGENKHIGIMQNIKGNNVKNKKVKYDFVFYSVRQANLPVKSIQIWFPATSHLHVA